MNGMCQHIQFSLHNDLCYVRAILHYHYHKLQQERQIYQKVFLLLLPVHALQVNSISDLWTHCIIVPCSGERATELCDLAGGFVDGYYVPE